MKRHRNYHFIILIIFIVVLASIYTMYRYRTPVSNKVYTAEENTNNINIKLAGINIDKDGLDDIIKKIGEPASYSWGEKVFSRDNLPDYYVLIYPDGFCIYMTGGKIVELRIFNSSYLYLNNIRLGSRIQDVEEMMGKPIRVETGGQNLLKDRVLYKDIEGHAGECYYSDKKRKVRLFFKNYRVDAIYLTRSDCSTYVEDFKDKAARDGTG